MTFPKHPLRMTRQPPCPHATISSDPPNDPDPLTKAEVRALSKLAGAHTLDSGVSKNTGQPKTRSLEQRGPEAQRADGMVQPEATGTSQRGDKSLRAGGVPQQESLIYHLRG